MSDERRRHPRSSFIGDIKYSGSDGISCLDIHDVSAGGLRLCLDGCEQPGTRIIVSLLLKSHPDRIEIPGQIVWARQAPPYDIGIRFLEDNSPATTRLQSYLEGFYE